MLTITKNNLNNVNEVYTLKGTAIGTPTDIRYIQLSRGWYTCRPIVNTRMAYNMGNVIVFETKSDAEDFIDKFMKSPNRKTKYDIVWEVIPYRTNKNCNYEFKELNDKEYGRYCVISKCWSKEHSYGRRYE